MYPDSPEEKKKNTEEEDTVQVLQKMPHFFLMALWKEDERSERNTMNFLQSKKVEVQESEIN